MNRNFSKRLLSIGTHRLQCAYSLVELLAVLAITALLVSAAGGAIHSVILTESVNRERIGLARDGDFALQRMVQTVAGSRRVLVPLADIPETTSLVESVRDPGVLAVTLGPAFDIDADGFADADNDKDGRLDEDLPRDTSNDGKPGIQGIDDDGNGTTDFWLSSNADDDESSILSGDEDPIDLIDNDDDGNIDEDPPADNNGDGCAGHCWVDDDGDGAVDEGNVADDDEDGAVDEDWYDPVVFYLDGSDLKERRPVPWDTDGNAVLDGRDYVVSVIAENVSAFRVERTAMFARRAQLLDLRLELTGPSGATIALQTHVRLGGSL